MSGLEVIGSIASVAQLAATVYSISKTLYEVADALSNASANIKDLAHDLETFSEELQLLSTLLDAKNNRYSDSVYRLTAKIIGDCATICVKIDGILRKLRSGSVWARMKWLYKEKEVMKLLARLRDLKLSLMGILSLLSALKADHMLNAMGVSNPSLIQGTKDEKLAREAMEDLEKTRRKLTGISIGQQLDDSISRTTLTPQGCLKSKASEMAVFTNFQQFPPPTTYFVQRRNHAIPTPSVTVAAKEVEKSVPNISITGVALPGRLPTVRNSEAMESVDSFHSAVSHQSHDLVDNNEVLVQRWRTDTIESAMKHFKMTRQDAESWTSSILRPSMESHKLYLEESTNLNNVCLNGINPEGPARDGGYIMDVEAEPKANSFAEPSRISPNTSDLPIHAVSSVDSDSSSSELVPQPQMISHTDYFRSPQGEPQLVATITIDRRSSSWSQLWHRALEKLQGEDLRTWQWHHNAWNYAYRLNSSGLSNSVTDVVIAVVEQLFIDIDQVKRQMKDVKDYDTFGIVSD
ncbi:hypothetical protein F5884DRAFT_864402 [Xylogone sp. PMI_703]|nr:hypothetical protein F5884DRAFT_864402 [Xylogone sp. PMI_703]